MLNAVIIFILAWLVAEIFNRLEIKEIKFVPVIVGLGVRLAILETAALLLMKEDIRDLQAAILVVAAVQGLLSWSSGKAKHINGMKHRSGLLYISYLFINAMVIYFALYYGVKGYNVESHSDHLMTMYNFLAGSGIIVSTTTKVCFFIIILILSAIVTSRFISFITQDLTLAKPDKHKHNQGTESQGQHEVTQGEQQAAAAAWVQEDLVERPLLIPPFTNFSSIKLTKEKEAQTEQYIQSEVRAIYDYTQEHNKDFHMERTLEITEKGSETEVKNKISYHTSRFNDSSPLIASCIGIIERFLIAALVVKGAYAGIAFLGALKAMARYKQFDEKSYAENFLLGTLVSALFGLIYGLLIIRIFNLDVI